MWCVHLGVRRMNKYLLEELNLCYRKYLGEQVLARGIKPML